MNREIRPARLAAVAILALASVPENTSAAAMSVAGAGGDDSGACCFANGTCIQTEAWNCTGYWLGYGAPCDNGACPYIRVCCQGQGVCDLTLVQACAGGVWHPELSSCNGYPCGEPTGACCIIGGLCSVTTPSNCQGTWHGAGTTCTPNPCPQPYRACCHPDGSCTVTTQAECLLPDVWHGEWGSCVPGLCPLRFGACCFPDGGCDWMPQSGCEAWGGIAWIIDVPCGPESPCPPFGACCLADGGCTVLREAECTDAGGWHWLGPDTSCTPNRCVCRGDCDCTGDVGFGDIDYFVEAIPDNAAGWHALYAARHGGQEPPCLFLNCDITGDGHVDFADIDPFVALIPSSCP